MFSFFKKKDGYKSIPDSQEVPTGSRYDEEVHVSPMAPSRSQRGGFGDRNGTESIRYRGDKRLIERGGDFHQSTGKIGLRKKIKQRYFRALYGMDLFHSLIDAPTPRILAILLGGYMLIILFFAVVYYAIGITIDCNMNISHFLDGFAFSLETMATIGYGTKDIFFDDCPLPLMVISAQVCVKLIADAVTIGVLYCKLSRPHARASTVIFSEKAIIRRVRGKLYFMFQLCELRKHQLVEAHVRVYVVRNEVDLSHCINDSQNEEAAATEPAPQRNKLKHMGSSYAFGSSMSSDEGSMEGLAAVGAFSKMKYHTLPGLPHHAADAFSSNGNGNGHASFHIHSAASVDGSTNVGRNRTHRPTYMQTSSMRLNHPNDELGGMLLLMTPQVVVHEIDAGSPLMPPPVWYCNFPCDERTGAVHSYHTLTGGGGLGSQQVGDQIRWRPPAYKNFIQHVPAPVPFPSRPSFEAGTNQPSFASPVGVNAPERREFPSQAPAAKKAASVERRASHRYNGIEEVVPQSNSGSSKRQAIQQAPTQQTPVPAPVFTEQVAPQSTWFYDAEALARIEFPSVCRRIDTDNISAASLPPPPLYSTQYAPEIVENGVPSTPQRPAMGQSSAPGSHQSEVAVRAPMPLRTSLGGHGVFFGSNSNLAESVRDGHGGGTPKHEAQEGQDWYFQSSGLNSYADLLNPTRPVSNLSPMTREGSYSNGGASSYEGSNNHNNHENLLDIDIPVTIDEDDESGDDNSPEQARSTAQKSTGSLSVSGGSTPIKAGADKVTTPVSRIPVFNRGASSYSLLAQPPFPAQVNAPSTAIINDSANAAIAAEEAPAITPKVSPAVKNQITTFQNPARAFPMERKSSADAARIASMDADDESVRSVSTVEVRTSGALSRAKSKRDMYVSPYKQQRSASMANVFATPPGPLTPTTPLTPLSPVPASTEPASAVQSAENGAAVPVAAPAPEPVPVTTPVPEPAPVVQATNTASSLAKVFAPAPPSNKQQDQEPPKPSPAPATRGPALVRAPAPASAATAQASPTLPPRAAAPGNQYPYTTNPLYSNGAAGAPSVTGAGHNVSFAASSPHFAAHNATTNMGGIREAGDWCSYQTWQSEERSMVQRYMRDRQIEIIVIVEGVDAATGGMVQARHSYTSDEIEWNKSFECCVFKDPIDGCTTIDFSQFHELVEVPDDAPFAGVVHSSI